MSAHSRFAPSASYRILNCPPSLMLCARAADQPSPYAAEGTCAHVLCAYLVERALGRDVQDPTQHLDYYGAEMQSCAEGYASFVLEEYRRLRADCPDADVLVEERVDISRWVPGCGGTADCIILADGTAEVIDYKYGLGVTVSAETEEYGGNTQLMCCCLGVLEQYDGIFDIDRVKMVIYQPRRENVSAYTLAPIAALALEGKGEFKAGDHCRFCKVKATCRKRAEYNLRLAQYDFQMPDQLEDHEIDAILLMADRLVQWAGDVKEYALRSAIQGRQYEHFKVVEGRSSRRFTSEAAVAQAVESAGFDPWERRLKGISAMTALLGRERFESLLGGLTDKPRGKPALVPKTDKRPAMKHTAAEDFSE